MSKSLEIKPYFSVIVPLFNKEPFVVRALDSIFSQNFNDFELIVVDDGSSDGGANLVEDLIRDRRECFLVRQTNQGAGKTRNRGITEARGEWVAFLDADDVWLPNHLAELRNIAKTCPDAGMIATNFREIYEGSEVLVDNRQNLAPTYCNYFLAASHHPGRINSSNVAIKLEVTAVVGLFGNAKSGQDLEYWARVAFQNKVAISERSTSVYYRGNDGNMEKIASRGYKSQAFLPKKLSDISPSLALIEKLSLADPSVLKRKDIQKYVNARLDNAIKIHFVNRNYVNLVSVRNLKFRSKTFTSFCLSGLASMPPYTLDKFWLVKSRLISN